MKITKIDSHNLKKTRDNSQRQKQDLTSFGAAQNNATSPVHSQKSAEAIKSKFLSGISFKGHTENFQFGFVGTAGAIGLNKAPTYDEQGQLNDSYSLVKLIGKSPNSHADSSIEETRKKNGYTTERVYFADPEEVVNNQTKKDHDFIVYDNRPHYPTIGKVKDSYEKSGQNADNLGQNYKTIAEYYYRREKADRLEVEKLEEERNKLQADFDKSKNFKNVLEEKNDLFPWDSKELKKDKEKSDYYYAINAQKDAALAEKIGFYKDRIEHSKKEQAKAVQAYKIFGEAAKLMSERDGLRYEMSSIVNANGWQRRSLEDSVVELEKAQKIAEEVRENITIARQWKDVNAKKLIRERENLERLSNGTYSERAEVRREIEDAEAEVKKFDKKLLILADKLIKAEAEIKLRSGKIEELKRYLKSNKERMPIAQREFDKKCDEIWSYWPKMEEFYRNNIEEWQY